MSGFIPTDYTTINPGPHQGVPTQFIFPVLKSAEILTCCHELEIELTKAELSEPQRHKDGIRKVFWQFLDICFGVTEEDLTNKILPNSGVKEMSPYPELHEEHMVDLLFFDELTRCMRVVGIYDFSLKDLHNPTAKRFRNQMSALINMAKFREEQLRKYYELMEPRNELVAALQEVHNEHELLVEQLQKTQQESNVKLEEIDSVLRECQDLESEIAKSNKLQASKREEASKLKREVNDLKDELASVTWALQEAQAENETLKGQVVSSPARRKKELAAKREEVEKEKEHSRKIMEEIEACDAKHAKYVEIIKELENLTKLQEQVLELVAKNKAEKQKIDETEKEISSNVEKTNEIRAQTEEAERALARAEEKLQQTRKQAKMQMEAAQDRLDIAKEQLILVEKERQDTKSRIEAGEAEVRQLEAQMQSEKENTERAMAELVSEFKVIEADFVKRNERRMQFIENAMH